jgi:hypothetical protein
VLSHEILVSFNVQDSKSGMLTRLIPKNIQTQDFSELVSLAIMSNTTSAGSLKSNNMTSPDMDAIFSIARLDAPQHSHYHYMQLGYLA